MDYEQFKIDVKSMDIWDFMNKWKNHPKYEEYNQKKYDEDFYEYVCEYYDYDKSLIRKWKIFKNSCDIYAWALTLNDNQSSSIKA